MSALHSYSIGDIRGRHPTAQVWVSSPADAERAKREYAAAHNTAFTSVWAEANKSPDGYIVVHQKQREAA